MSNTCSVAGCDRPIRYSALCSMHYQRKRKTGTTDAIQRTGFNRDFLLANVHFSGDACLLWPFATVGSGYGIIRGQKSGRRSITLAHRLMCKLAHGAPPNEKLQAAHSCNNRLCVNPRHLRWATCSDNIMDKHLHGTMSRGEAHPRAKLTGDLAMQVYSADGEQRALAREYGVSQSTVSAIKNGRNWAWLTKHPRPAGLPEIPTAEFKL